MNQTEFKLRTVADYLTEPEARVVECVLAMQGIPCLLTNAETVGFLQADGNAIRGVTVQVAECNWEAAQSVLTPQHLGQPEWECSACGTNVDAEFDKCWQCGQERGSTAKSPVVVTPLPEPDLPDETLDEQNLRRAWFGAVIGFFAYGWIGLCLSGYSLWLLVRIDYQRLATMRRFEFETAFALDLLSIAGLLWAMALSGRF